MSKDKPGAGFQEVMHHFQRMCEAHADCKMCPVGMRSAETQYSCECWLAFCSEGAEQAIMSWSLAHPEPRYPTFREWAGHVMSFSKHENEDKIVKKGRDDEGTPWELTVRWNAVCYETPYDATYYRLDALIPKHIAKLLGVEKSIPAKKVEE